MAVSLLPSAYGARCNRGDKQRVRAWEFRALLAGSPEAPGVWRGAQADSAGS